MLCWQLDHDRRHWRLSEWRPPYRKIVMVTASSWQEALKAVRMKASLQKDCYADSWIMTGGIEGCHNEGLPTERLLCWQLDHDRRHWRLSKWRPPYRKIVMLTAWSWQEALKAVRMTASQQKDCHADSLIMTGGTEGCHNEGLPTERLLCWQLDHDRRHWRLSEWQPPNKKIVMLTAWSWQDALKAVRVTASQHKDCYVDSLIMTGGIEGCQNDDLPTERLLCWQLDHDRRHWRLSEWRPPNRKIIMLTAWSWQEALKTVRMTASQQKVCYTDSLIMTGCIKGCQNDGLPAERLLCWQLDHVMRHWRLSEWQPPYRKIVMLTAWSWQGALKAVRMTASMTSGETKYST